MIVGSKRLCLRDEEPSPSRKLFILLNVLFFALCNLMNNMKTVKYTFLGKEHLHVQISVVVVVFFTQELTIPYLDPAFPYFLLIAETQKRKAERYKEWKEGVMD